jgi:hypothetical protein
LGFQGDNRAQRKGFENTRDLAGDLFGAKNAGVTRDPAAGRFTITHRSRGHAMACLLDGGSRTCTSLSPQRPRPGYLAPLHPHTLLPTRRSIQPVSAAAEHGTTGQWLVQRGHGVRRRRSASRRSPSTQHRWGSRDAGGCGLDAGMRWQVHVGWVTKTRAGV